MSDWQCVMHIDDCPMGQVREVIVGERIVAVGRIEQTFYAVDGICLHQGGPLGRGSLDGCQLRCPWHGWHYDLATGCHTRSDAVRLAVWKVDVRGDHVWLAPPDLPVS